MTFRAFSRRSPADSDPNFTQMAGIRANLISLASAIAAGAILPGWNYTNSVTRAESSPGTAALPARMYASFATDTKTIWVRVAITWSAGGYPTKMTFSWSDDDEASYANLTDIFGNYVLTITYDGSSNVTAMTWGAS